MKAVHLPISVEESKSAIRKLQAPEVGIRHQEGIMEHLTLGLAAFCAVLAQDSLPIRDSQYATHEILETLIVLPRATL